VDSNGQPVLNLRWHKVLLVLTWHALVYVNLQLHQLLYAWFTTATVISLGQAGFPQPLQGIRTACKHQGTLHMVTACTVCSWAVVQMTGRVVQLEPQLERVQQRSEDLRAELQASKQENSRLSQQVAEMEAAAAMHLAQQVGDWT